MSNYSWRQSVLNRIKRWWKHQEFVEESWLIWRADRFRKCELVPVDVYPWAHTVGTPGSVNIEVSGLLTETSLLSKFIGVVHLHPPAIGAIPSGTDLGWLDGWFVALGHLVVCAIFDGTDFRVYVNVGDQETIEISVKSVFGKRFYWEARTHIPGFATVFPTFRDFICTEKGHWHRVIVKR